MTMQLVREQLTIEDVRPLNLEKIGINGEVSLLTMHLTEIEEEADNVLDLLTLTRAHAHRSDAVAGQEALVELSVALEHLLHHAQEAVPALQRELDIEDDDDIIFAA